VKGPERCSIIDITCKKSGCGDICGRIRPDPFSSSGELHHLLSGELVGSSGVTRPAVILFIIRKGYGTFFPGVFLSSI
jgi:hypothetical protein